MRAKCPAALPLLTLPGPRGFHKQFSLTFSGITPQLSAGFHQQSLARHLRARG